MAGHHGINSAGSSAAAAANTTVAKSDTVLGADDKHVLNPESSDLSALYGFTPPFHEEGDNRDRLLCVYTPLTGEWHDRELVYWEKAFLSLTLS